MTQLQQLHYIGFWQILITKYGYPPIPRPISNLKLERKQNLGCERLPGLDEELFSGFKNTAIVS